MRSSTRSRTKTAGAPHLPSSRSEEEGRLSIGALSRATGIPIETIRTWERRYGVPKPLRKPSGHRVYPLSVVPRLRRAAEAVARGHRPAEVVPISESALDDLLASVSTQPDRVPPALAPPDLPVGTPGDLRDLMRAVATFDSAALRRSLEIRWLAEGAMPFLEHTLTPFLEQLGVAWQDGALAVRHEHFASARVGDFLRERRRPYEEQTRGPRAALLTLPGDLHELGLLMASLVFAMEGWQVLYLGASTPVEQAGSLARDARLDAVAVSVSAAQDSTSTLSALKALRRALPRGVPLVVGGAGVPDDYNDRTVSLENLKQLQAWARENA